MYPKAIRLYHRYKDREMVYILPLVLISLTLKLRYFFRLLAAGNGFPQSDDSRWYLEYARALTADFKIGLHMNDILYFGYNTLLALLLVIFRDPVAIVFIQAVTAGLSVILVYKISRRLFNRSTAVIASLFYADLWDITLWSMYILSDSFFISLLLLCVYFLLLALETGKKGYTVLFVITSMYMLVFRPTGVISLAFIMLYILIRLDKKTLKDFADKYKLAIGGCLTAVAAVCIYVLAGDKLTPLITSLQINAKMVLYNIYAKGWIYDKPSSHDYLFKPDYSITILNSLILSFIINNWDHVLMLYARRTVAFIGWWVWESDAATIRGAARLAWHLIPSALFLAGTVAAWRSRLFRRTSIVWLVILAVFVFCLLLFIDGLYRYRAPALPFIAIAAAYGADRIITGTLIFAKKQMGMRLWNKEKR